MGGEIPLLAGALVAGNALICVGPIASSAVIGVTYHTGVTDANLHVLASVMIAVSVFALIITLADRSLRTTSAAVPDATATAQRAS